MLIRFEDSENNETYLRTVDNLTFDTIKRLCIDYFKQNEPYRKVTEMLIVEWAIRKQLMILLTDSETEEVIKENAKIK
jgi:hypothetical protein